MMQSNLPLTKELVLIGGGHTHALVLRKWGMNPLPGARLTLINPGPTAPYTGMLPGHVAGHYAKDDLLIDLVRLARFAGARLVNGTVDGIDREAQHIHVPARAPIAYDIASINVGITSDLPDLTGFNEHAIGAKPLGPYATSWEQFRASALDGSKTPGIAVVGGGVGGVELALAMAHRLTTDGHAPNVTVLDQGQALSGLDVQTKRILLHHAARLNVNLRENVTVTEITQNAVKLAAGPPIASQFTIGVAGARPHAWLRDTGLDLSEGFITVDTHLRSSDLAIYAAGDCAALPDPRPKAGVFAVREAPILYHNLRAELTGTKRRVFKPQSKYLKLISLGEKSAMADTFGGRLCGPWVWRWKDWIDQRFMDKFQALPTLPAPKPPRFATNDMALAMGSKPMCGGCGAKVGSKTLAAITGNLRQGTRDDILSVPGDDAAILRVGNATQVLTTDHLRAFTDDPWIMAHITAVHALGDIWAMGAAPQSALASIILPRLTTPMQRDWLAEIMDGASAVFTESGAEIVGGHTTVGAELTLGFSVTGLLDRPAITLAGARAGDQLVLTKPIGSGTLMAAEMAMQAKGTWVTQAMDVMAQSQGTAAMILKDAHAMTDVTGFGLAGHLMGICKSSSLSAMLDLSSIPFFEGAVTLAQQGIRSTLYPDNRSIADTMTLPLSPQTDLLFDPQTAGGLLAALPANAAKKALPKLKDAGYCAAIIGELSDGAPFITAR